MARAHAMIAAGLFALAAGLTGCQQSKPVSMVELPAPNFGGPILNSPALTPPGGRPQVAENTNKITNPPPPRGKVLTAAPMAVPAGIPADWVPSVAKKDGPWRWIVIHHSATTVGGANRFDREHRAKGWDELGYHFVIGNGTDTTAGAVEVGTRWPKQKYGAHAKTPSEEFNKYGIGICLVGNFDQSRPSDAQVKALAKLTAYLMKTYHIPPDRIIGHGNTKATDCPGRNVNLADLRRRSTQILADAGEPIEPTRTASAATELLVDRRPR